MSQITNFISFTMVCGDSKIVIFIQHTTFVDNKHPVG